MIALAYIVLRTVYPAGMAPGQPLWVRLRGSAAHTRSRLLTLARFRSQVVCLVWLAATHAADLFDRFGAPRELGMLVAGVLLRSVPAVRGGSPALLGLKLSWSRDIRAGAMALVLLRAGLGLNLRTARSYGASFLAFTTLPSLAESLLGMLVAHALFGMPLLLAWALGWIVAAVGPGVVSAACAAVKERGYAPRAPNFLVRARACALARAVPTPAHVLTRALVVWRADDLHVL
jgi:hypothetical protein